MSFSLELLVRWRVLVLIAFASVTALAAPGLWRIELDNSPEAFFLRDAEALREYHELEARFGRDRVVRVAIQGSELWTPEGLLWLQQLGQEADRIPGVVGSAGLYQHHAWGLSRWPPDPADFRRRVIADPVDLNAGFVNASGDRVTLLISLYRQEPAELDATLDRLEDLAASAPVGLQATLVGLPMVDRALDQEIRRLARVLFPALALVSAIFLLCYFGPTLELLAPALTVTAGQIVTFGAIGWLGEPLNVVTIILAPLQFVIAVATGVHVVAAFRALRATGLSPERATVETYRIKAWPVLWTGLTTAVGFGSFALSPVPPVRQLGEWAAFGISFGTLCALFLLPASLAFLSRSGSVALSGRERSASKLGRRLATSAVAHRRVLHMAFGLALLLSLAGMPRFEADTNVLHYFRPQHPIRSGLERVEEDGVGVIGADLVLDLRKSPVSTLGDLEAIEALARRLRSLPEVLGVLSVSELWRSTAVQLGTERSDSRAATGALADDNAWLQIERTGELSRVRNSLITPDGGHARIALFFPMQGFEQLEPLLASTLEIAGEQLPTAAATLTGRYPLVMSAQRSLLRTMLFSLSLTAFCILVVFLSILRRPALAIRALLPNLLPIAIVLGTMAWFSVPIDSTTMMIATVALGLAVDDTLHTLGVYRHLVAELGPRGAAIESLARGAGAYIATAAVLVAGFLTCAFAGLVPVSRFGSLTALAVVAALAADLLLVPALLGSTPTRQGVASGPGS